MANPVVGEIYTTLHLTNADPTGDIKGYAQGNVYVEAGAGSFNGGTVTQTGIGLTSAVDTWSADGNSNTKVSNATFTLAGDSGSGDVMVHWERPYTRFSSF